MKKNHLLKKSGVVGIIVIFICASFVSSIGGYSEEINQIDTEVADVCEPKENVLVTCHTFGFPGEPSQEITMSLSEAELLYDKIKDLQIEIAQDPLSDKTRKLQHEIIALADEYNLLPAGLSPETLKSRLIQSSRPQHPKITLPRLQNRASELFCNYVSTGSGTSFPIIILPRLIPILLTPIPRLFVRWSTMDGVTSCGGLRSGTGFIAIGPQNGIALGFWGIGFSIFLPPFMAYGLLGYALFASVNAQEIELWPPNYPPEITAVSPLDGTENVPISTSELRFQINDLNGDPMSYSVTTTPDIGSGSENNKPDGTYTVPISGLEGSEEYTWHVQVSDGEEVVDESFTFSTEQVAPIVSDPNPEDGERYVSVDLSQLSFELKDLQGDLMDYTVETVPDIGSGSGTGVGDGTYSVDVSGLDYSTEYTWYVNATDGMYWKHKVFNFQAEHKMIFNPFDEGWQNRKQITIDHTKVTGDLTNFPVLVSVVDSDLRDKAQVDGDDILFMDGIGVATRLYHEIEQFDGSSGELVAWVNVSNLASNQDTTLYIYYGNPTCCNQQAPELVWDSDYMMVHHMKDEPDNSHIMDSTVYDCDGIKKGSNEPSEVNGKMGKAQNFDGSNDYIDTKDFDINDDFTVSLWINPSSTVFNQCFLGKHESLEYGGDNILLLGYYKDNTEGNSVYIWKEVYRGGVMTSDWHQMIYVGEKIGSSLTKMTVYKNGIVLWQHNLTGVVGDTLGRPWTIGQDWDSSQRTDFFHGGIDEIRVINSVKNAEWVSTSYNNQNDPSSFLSFGPEETGP